ncbi:MAG: YitT family protein [Clostridia bacterium]|nr:YitT family protein [Clostridia bacterium]
MKLVKDYAIITLSCFLYAFAFNCFFDANNLAMGGFTGIAQVLNRFIPALPIGTTVFIMNVPLMIIGVKKQGWSILFASVYAIFASSLMIDGMNMIITFPATEPLLACIYGGVLLGVSLGLMMLKSATTGGTELAARLLKYIFKNISIGKLCLFIDVAVICIYALTFRSLDNALYGIIAMYVSSLAMDMVVYGSVNAKLAYIISDKGEEIKQKLMSMGLGATIINGSGAFTGNQKNILMCAAKPNKIARIKAAVNEVDPKNAFIIVTDAKEVFGEGFGEYSNDSL